jgi:RNA polymerase sigma factor (sigma-70 family)
VTTSLSRVDGPGDAELISAVRGGDVDAYGELFARHVDSARRLARQLTGPGDADDLVSDAFTKVLLVLQRGGGPDLAFRAYLLTAVRRLHVDKLRSGARLRSVGDLTPFDPGLPFHDTAVEGFENAAAARAFASLPERWQMVLWHTEVEQQKPADIAPLLGMSANSVSALAYRAREGLRQAFLSQHAVDPDDVDCAWTRDHLGAYIRGGLSRRDGARVDDHIEGCRACAAVYLELTEVNSGLAALLAPLLLGTAGLGYLATGSGSSTVATSVTAAKSWVATHASLSAVGGVALTATAAVAVYAVTQLAGHHAPPQGSPPALDRPSASASRTPGQHQSGQHSHGPGSHHRGNGPQRGGGTLPTDRASSADPSTATSGPATGPTSAPTSTTTDPSSGPTSGPTSEPTSAPTSAPTSEPTSQPTSAPTTQPSTPPPPPVQITFTSTPPANPAIGTSYQVSVTGGSGQPISVTVDPATTNAACSMSGATTVHFDHAGTCVLAAQESPARTTRAARATARVTQSIVVPQIPQSVTIDSPAPSDPRVDGSYSVSASSTSGRAVTLSVDAPTNACTLTGSAVSFHHVGPCVVTATQAGDADLAEASGSQSFTVGQGTQTIALVPDAPSTGQVGGHYDFTATGGASGNDVVVTSANTDVCGVVGSTVTFLNPGTCVISANQAGNTDYEAAPAFSASINVVNPHDADLAVTAVKSADIGGLSGVTATVSGLPVGSTATLTATADGSAAFQPDNVLGGVCTTAGSTTTWMCTVTPDRNSLTFRVNTQQGRDVTFSVTPDAPLVDTDPSNNSFGVHWSA